MTTLASIITLLAVIPSISGLSCYDNSASSGVGGSSASGVATTQILNNCNQCQKYTTMYNTAGLNYNQVRYQCVTGTASTSLSGTGCQGSYNVVAYSDGSVFSRSCTCCTNNCNGDAFCTPNDQQAQQLLQMGGGISGRCNTASSATYSMALMAIGVAAATYF